MQNEHFSQSGRPTMTIGTGGLMARYRDGTLRLMRKEDPEHEIARLDADILAQLPYMMPLIYKCLEKDATLPESTRHCAARMARRIRYATQMRCAPEFTRERVAKKAAELFGLNRTSDEPDITISREDLKAILAQTWGAAMEEFLFTPFEDRANHIFPAMAQLLELLAGPNEELREFIDDALSEEVEAQITQGVRNLSA